MKLAFVGFRHGHVGAYWREAKATAGIEVVAAVEEDAAARAAATRDLGVASTHATLADALRETRPDAVVCVDVFARRGAIVLEALAAGAHVFADKPLCTKASELRAIQRGAARRERIVLCDLPLRFSGTVHAARALVQSGAIGTPATATVHGRHGLGWGERPAWYFEPGQHGGTFNDLLVHGLDTLRFVTGQSLTRVAGASAGAAKGSPAPAHFQQAALCVFEMDGGLRVMADVSYLAPKGHGAPWRFELWGTDGSLTFTPSGPVTVRRAGRPEEIVPPSTGFARSPFADFVAQARGEPPAALTPEDCFRATAAALTIQAHADREARRG